MTEKDAPRVVCTQGHTDRRECCSCCAWGTPRGYACCATLPEATMSDRDTAENDAPREPGECGECDRPEQFSWDPIRWESGGPVMVCHRHGALAPGWAYAGPGGPDRVIPPGSSLAHPEGA